MMFCELRQRQTISRPAMATLITLALTGCSVLGLKPTQETVRGPAPSQETPTADSDSRNFGYMLMHSILDTQKNSDKLLIIKHVSPQVKKIIKEISETTDKIDEDLKIFAKGDPNIKLDRNVLPLIEVKVRESALLERGLQLVGTSGKPLERLLLLTQSGVLTTERHLSRVMRDSETIPERKKFWNQTAKTFDEIYAKLQKLLEDEYYTR